MSSMTSAEKRPILVTGAHRTGTTWIGRMLAAEDGVAYISEPLNVLHRPGVFRAPVKYWYTYITPENEASFLPAFREVLEYDYHVLAELRSIRSRKDLLRMVRDFQSIIGRETREQMLKAENRLPDSLIACIGGGSNAMGLFHPFLDEPGIEIYGVEAAGLGLDSGKHAASIAGGKPGVLHGNRTHLLMDDDGQIDEAHSISAGLDYPGIGPATASPRSSVVRGLWPTSPSTSSRPRPGPAGCRWWCRRRIRSRVSSRTSSRR